MSSEDFFKAIQSGNEIAVRQFVQSEPGLRFAKNQGVSPILWAVYYGQPRIAGLLIEQDPQVDLFEAAATGQANQVAELLGEHPDQVNAYAEDGFTALGLAAFFGHLEVAQILLSRGAEVNQPARNGIGATPLHSAAAGQHLAICELLVEAGADVNAREEGGFTALHIAADNGQVELVHYLLAQGGDRSAQSEGGKTAFALAAEKGHREAIAALQN